jgi:hypothetical protein
MSDDIDTGGAGVVLELEADLILFRCSLPRRDPSEHPALWARIAKRLWFKVFQMSTWEVRTSAEVPLVPSDLPRELAEIASARQAAIHVLASVLVAVSGHSDRLAAEAERINRNVVRFLETLEGQDQKAQVHQSLAGDLRAAGLEVKSLE